MFWRFGFHNASSIDSLLDKDDVSLEAILDDDDLLQECKAQNTRLIDYFQRVDILQRLLAYVTGQIETEEKGQFKYPYTATEVLCSEIWSIVETCINEQNQLLLPFWEVMLDRPPEEMKMNMLMASRWAKVNAVFLGKKPAEMLAFIQSQPSVVERLLKHIETPSIMDLLVRIIQMDEMPGGTGALEWLSSQDLMPRLLSLLSPMHPPDVHQVSSELIKGIISLATPSPGVDLQNGPASNRFARELAHKDSILKLTGYILQDFGPNRNVVPENDDESAQVYPTFESATSSVVHSMGVLIELIRKNNSDYFEPYLFHTVRNRLMQAQSQISPGQDPREYLESSMAELVDRMGVVHLGPILEIMSEHLDTLTGFLKNPRSSEGPVSTTVGNVVPLTFERFRICELLAELLHCSNMSLLNRSSEFDNLYDSIGRLQGGLSGLEQLARVVTMAQSEEPDQMDTPEVGAASLFTVRDYPMSRSSSNSSIIDSDEDMSDDEVTHAGSLDDEVMEEVEMSDEPRSKSPAVNGSSLGIPGSPSATSHRSRVSSSPTQISSPLSISPTATPSSPAASPLPSVLTSSPTLTASSIPEGVVVKTPSRSNSLGHVSNSSGTRHLSRQSSLRANSLANSATEKALPPGEVMKSRMLNVNVLSTLLDLFSEYPWNNFLHSAVYDMIHQILTGNVASGLNRELTIALFRDAKLLSRIVEMQKKNDEECAKPKGLRLGYMGHLTLISEDVIIALTRFPRDLHLILTQYASKPDWEEYVDGRYAETKQRDTSLLGGGKPVIAPGGPQSVSRWKVDEADPNSASALSPGVNGPQSPSVPNGHEQKGEFKRTSKLTRESSADFGPPDDVKVEEAAREPAPHFSRYMSDEDMNTSPGFGDSDDEDEDEGWLARSKFSLSNPPVSARHSSQERRPLPQVSWEDAFSHSSTHDNMVEDPFSSEEDAFGPFSDAGSSGSDPFTFPSSFSDEMEGSSFESFGEFGDFQSPTQEGQLTPTGGSWMFTSDVISDDSNSDMEGTPKRAKKSDLDPPDTPEDDKRMA